MQETHKWDSCHYTDEILGLKPVDNLRQIPIEQDKSKLLKTVEELSGPMRDVSRSKKLVAFKARLKLFVDRIDFKPDGKLAVPKALLDLESYVDRFFN